MSNETKRDVFETIADKCAGYDDELYKQYLNQYDAALPDDLPVIPKAVGEYIKSNRTEQLGKVFWYLGCISVTLLDSTRWYIVNHTEDFASAWVLGVWRIEETGEIVKLEAGK